MTTEPSSLLNSVLLLLQYVKQGIPFYVEVHFDVSCASCLPC